MDEAGSRWRRSTSFKAPTRSWSTAAPERGAACQGARASATGSRGSRLSRRCVDVRAGGYDDPKGVWSQLPSCSRQPFAQGFEAEPAKTAAPSESEGRGGNRALERGEVAFPQKGAQKEGRTIVFADQSGFYLLPMVVRTYAPVGKTPVLEEHLSRDHLSAMSAITREKASST